MDLPDRPGATRRAPLRPAGPPRRRTGWWIAGVLVVCAALAAGVMYWRSRTDGPSSAASGAPAGQPAASAAPSGADAAKAGKGAGRGGAGGPTPVTAAAATRGPITVSLSALGTVIPRTSVVVHPRVDGQLAEVRFTEGQMVKAGQLIALIDPRPFEVQLASAEGQLARDQAQLANAEADQQRYQGLLAQDAIARQQVDTQAALVRQLRGQIAIDQAAVDTARLNLSYTRVVAPSSGRTGLRQVDPGNMVRATDTNGLVLITEVQPIDVVFPVPQDQLQRVLARLREATRPPVTALDRDGRTQLATGELLTADNQVDVTTGTVKLKARFANTDGALFPNQFVNVRLALETRDAVTVPTAAIQRGAPGLFAYVVADDGTVSVRPLKLGAVEGDRTEVVDGLRAGERVVTDGTDRLREGARVEVIDPRTQGGGAGPGGGRRRGGGANGAAGGDAAKGASGDTATKGAPDGDATKPAASGDAATSGTADGARGPRDGARRRPPAERAP